MTFFTYGKKQPLKYTTTMADYVRKHHPSHLNVDSIDWNHIPSCWDDDDCNQCILDSDILQSSEFQSYPESRECPTSD